MPLYQVGAIIKNQREELGLTQEELADGICSVPTLSRIESGLNQPNKNHLEMLLQRLGYSFASSDVLTDKQQFMSHEMKNKVREAYVEQDYPLAMKHLRSFDMLSHSTSHIDKQFSMLYHTLLDQSQCTNAEKLKQLETALLLTCPKYKTARIPHVLSYEEIILLNNIAICYEKDGNSDLAISILTALKDYYQRHIVSNEETLRTEPMILYNLSKMLGLYGRYDECIAICDLGIHMARATGRCQVLGQTLFNRAWVLIQRNQPGDHDAARYGLKQAYYFSEVMQHTKEKETISKFYEESFSEKILI